MKKRRLFILRSTLKRNVLLLHCGEPEAILFCQQLKEQLRGATKEFVLFEVNCSDPGGTSQADDPNSSLVVQYLRSFDVSIAKYDHILAHPQILMNTDVPITVFCMERACFESRIFRNAFVHHTDAAGIRPGINAIPILFNISYEELKQQACGDEHLVYTLRRAFLTIRSSEVSQVAEVIRGLLKDLPNDRALWHREKFRWLLGKYLVAISYNSHKVSSFLLIPLIALFLLLLFKGDPEVASIMGPGVGCLAAFLFGLRLSDIPATPAFAEHRQDITLKQQKVVRYKQGLRVPGAAWFFVAVSHGALIFHIMTFIAGFAIGIFGQRWSYIVYQLRLRLTGAENFTEHLAQQIIPILEKVAPLKVPKRLSFDKERDWRTLWDIFAMRLIPSMSRTFLSSRPHVFISYVWQDQDQEFALHLADFMNKCGISHFLDLHELKRGLPWRSRIAVEISKASHFILILSRRTTIGETCALEVRQALACLPISAWPRIIVCTLDDDNRVLNDGGDAVFRYILEKAERVQPYQLLDTKNTNFLKDFIHSTRPECYFEEFFNHIIRFGFRRQDSHSQSHLKKVDAQTCMIVDYLKEHNPDYVRQIDWRSNPIGRFLDMVLLGMIGRMLLNHAYRTTSPKAISLLSKAIAISSSKKIMAKALFYRGSFLYCDKVDADTSIADYSLAIWCDPNDIWARKDRATIYEMHRHSYDRGGPNVALPMNHAGACADAQAVIDFFRPLADNHPSKEKRAIAERMMMQCQEVLDKLRND